MTPYFCNFNKLFFANLDACKTVTISLMDIVIISIIVIITIS